MQLIKLKVNTTYAIQFHPEVYHSTDGKQLLENFLVHIAGVAQTWTSDSFVDDYGSWFKSKSLEMIKLYWDLSGGVDSYCSRCFIT